MVAERAASDQHINHRVPEANNDTPGRNRIRADLGPLEATMNAMERDPVACLNIFLFGCLFGSSITMANANAHHYH